MSSKEERKQIKSISFIEGYNPTLLESTVNELVDAVNLLLSDRILKYKYSKRDDELFCKISSLNGEGVDVFNLPLRKVGKLLGLKHPQTVKNILLKYRLLKCSGN